MTTNKLTRAKSNSCYRTVDCRSNSNRQNARPSPGYHNQSGRNPNDYKRYSNDTSKRSSDNKEKPRAFVIDAEPEDYYDDDADCGTLVCEANACSSNGRPTLKRLDVEAEMGGCRINTKMLIDTGATASFINPKKLPKALSFLVDLFLEGKDVDNSLNLKKSKFKFKSAFHQTVEDCAVAKVKLRINNWIGEHEFVLANTNEAAILGVDFFERYRATYDFENNAMIIKDENTLFHLNFIAEENKEIPELQRTTCFKAFACDDKVIKPNSALIIRATASELDTKVKTVMFEAVSKIDTEKGLLWANSVSEVNEHKTFYVNIVNASDREVRVEKNSVIGEVSELEDDSVPYTDDKTDVS